MCSSDLIRVDSHVYNNYFVPPNYDSLVGKLIAYGDTREQAIARMQIALSEAVVEGIKTNLPLHVELMQDAALNMVRPLFATLPGVSAPPPFGGSARTILVNVQPDRLRAYNLTPDEIVTALNQANTLSPAGSINLGGQSPIIPVNAVVKNIQDLAAVPLRAGSQGAVFVRDVATVDDGSDLVTSYALVNGRRTVYMPVTKRSDASTLSVVELVRQSLPKFQAAVPDDIKVSYEFDQSPVVLRAIGDLVKAVIEDQQALIEQLESYLAR